MISFRFSRVKRLFYRQYVHVLGVAIRDHQTQMVELDLRSAVPVLKNCVIGDCVPIVPEDPVSIADCADSIRRLMQINGITARHAYSAVGGRNLYMRETEFPRMKKRELAEAVRWEMERDVPYEAGSYYYDFSVIDDNAAGTMRVLMAAAFKPHIDALMASFASAGLQLLAVEGESIALGRMTRCAADALLIDIGAAGSTMFFYRRGIPVTAHQVSFSMDCAVLTQKSEIGGQSIAAFAEEIKRAVDYYTRQYPAGIAAIDLCGAMNLNFLSSELTQILNLPVRPLSVCSGYIPSRSLDAYGLQDQLSQAAIAMGLALRGVRL